MAGSGLAPDQNNWEVPDYAVTEFQPKRTKYCVCVFVINEGEKIITQLTQMQTTAKDADIIIADGGSSDGSLLPGRLASLGVRALLVKKGGGKLSAQMRMAFAYALQQGYAGVVTIDGNNKDDSRAIPLFVQALDEDFDHVQGSRFIKGGRAFNTPWLRLLAIKMIHAPLISLAARFRYTDTTNGFRGYSERLLRDPRIALFRHVFSAYELHYYLAIRAPRLGFNTKELPVTRKYPDRGATPTKISPLRGNLLIIKTLLKACFHRFDPPSVNLPSRGTCANG